jgi:hypothetical protein
LLAEDFFFDELAPLLLRATAFAVRVPARFGAAFLPVWLLEPAFARLAADFFDAVLVLFAATVCLSSVARVEVPVRRL